MSDLIDRQAAINALGERPMVWTDSDYEIAQRNQYDMDKLAIETVPAAQTERQWISCSERLPFDAGYYLTTTTYNEVFCDYWNLNEWNRTEQVIAWMPLPKPYKEDDHETD